MVKKTEQNVLGKKKKKRKGQGMRNTSDVLLVNKTH